MNRIVEPQSDQALQTSQPRSSIASTAARQISSPGIAYSLFGPLHYEPNYAYPLIVWLHGAGGDEREMQTVMPHISLRNYVGVAPRGTTRREVLSDGTTTYAWRQSSDEILTALDRVLDCVEIAKARFHIADRRVFLAGFGAGGTMALRLALAEPQAFAGAASFGGPLPRQHMPLRNIQQARKMPLMLAYGRDAQAYGEDSLCHDLRLMHIAGLKSLNIRQYPCGDDLVTQMLKDLDAWVMQLVTGTSMTASTDSAGCGREEWN